MKRTYDDQKSRNGDKKSENCDGNSASATMPLLSEEEIPFINNRDENTGNGQASHEGLDGSPEFKSVSQAPGPELTENHTRKVSLEIESDNALTSPSFATSTSPWSTSAEAPLLSDVDQIEDSDGEKSPESPNEDKKRLFSTAEYKIVFSHFIVRYSRMSYPECP